MRPDNQSSKSSRKRQVPDDTAGVETHNATQKLAPAIGWYSRVSDQDSLYDQHEVLDYPKLQPKKPYPRVDRREEYQHDTLGFEALYQKQQYEVDFVEMQDEDPLAELDNQFQQMGLSTGQYLADDSGSQSLSNKATKKKKARKVSKQGKSQSIMAKGK